MESEQPITGGDPPKRGEHSSAMSELKIGIRDAGTTCDPMTSGVSNPNSKSCQSTSGGWMFPALLVVVLVVAVGFAKFGPASTGTPTSSSPPVEWSPTAQPQGETVGLTIDFGNGSKQLFEALPWREGLTVEDLMREAVRYRPGIHFSQHGKGETGFLQSIEGLKNQGTSGRNWMYEVNDRFAEMSFCLQKLEPGDRVLWKFAGQE